MKGFRHYTRIGHPYHGLATNLTFTTGDGQVLTVMGDGPCIEARNPSVPTIEPSEAQIDRDALYGLEWRDYALLTGTDRAFNGSPDHAIGGNAWLYCDTNGNPWVVTLEQSEPDGDHVTIEVWRRQLFGRITQRDLSAIEDELLASFDFVPQIPPWDTSGHTSTTLALLLDTQDHTCTVPNAAGNACIVNVFSYSGLAQTVYNETVIGYGSSPIYRALVGLLRVDLSGAGDIDTDGSGITATITETHRYVDLVLQRDTWTNPVQQSAPTYTYGGSGTTAPPVTAPTTVGETTTTTEVFGPPTIASGGNPYQTQWVKGSYTAIVYSHWAGFIKKEYLRERRVEKWYIESGQYSCNVEWTAVNGVSGLEWQHTGCSSGSNSLATTVRVLEYDDFEVTFNFFDTESIGISALRRDDSDYNSNGFGPSDRGEVSYRCDGTVTPSGTVNGTPTFTYQINGVDYPDTMDVDAVDLRCSIRIVSNNVFMAHTHWYTENGLANTRYKELRAVCCNNDSASLEWSEDTTYAAIDALFTDEPFYISYQPVTLQFALDAGYESLQVPKQYF